MNLELRRLQALRNISWKWNPTTKRGKGSEPVSSCGGSGTGAILGPLGARDVASERGNLMKAAWLASASLAAALCVSLCPQAASARSNRDDMPVMTSLKDLTP